MTLTMPPETEASIHHTLSLYGVPEARHALAMLEAGRVDGRYWHDSSSHYGCLIGTLHSARFPDATSFTSWSMLSDLGMRAEYFADVGAGPAQRWFDNILPGHTPANNGYARLAATAIQDWLNKQVVDLADWNPFLQPEATAQAVNRILKEA